MVLGLSVWPETYESRAALLVKLGRENITAPHVSPTSQQQIMYTGLRKEDLISEIEILTNRSIVEEVVEKLGTDFLYPKSARPETLLKKIKYVLKTLIKKARTFFYEILYQHVICS